MRGDDRARHHGLARSGRRDQHPQIVPGQDLDGRLLRPGQHGRAGECLRDADRALIGQVQLAACLRGEFGHGGEHAARHDQSAVDGLVEELQEPGDVPGGGAHPLLLVELREPRPVSAGAGQGPGAYRTAGRAPGLPRLRQAVMVQYIQVAADRGLRAQTALPQSS